jgi:hypothetical protein
MPIPNPYGPEAARLDDPATLPKLTVISFADVYDGDPDRLRAKLIELAYGDEAVGDSFTELDNQAADPEAILTRAMPGGFDIDPFPNNAVTPVSSIAHVAIERSKARTGRTPRFLRGLGSRGLLHIRGGGF